MGISYLHLNWWVCLPDFWLPSTVSYRILLKVAIWFTICSISMWWSESNGAVSTGTQGSRRLYMSCVRKNIKVVDNSWTNSIKVCYKWIPVVVCPHCFFLTKHWPSATVGTKKQNGSSTCPKHLSQTSSFLTFTNSVYEVYMMPFLSDVFPKLYIQPSNQSPTKPKVSLLVRCSIAQSTVGSSNCQRMLGLSNPLSKKPSKKKGATV